MNFRIFLLCSVVFLAACNEDNSSSNTTFETPVSDPVTEPAEHVVTDSTIYSGAAEAALRLADVSERPSLKRHEMKNHGENVKFTASAGHLIAYAPNIQNPKAKDPQAAIFYTAYTRG